VYRHEPEVGLGILSRAVTWDPSTQWRAQAKLKQHKQFLELQSRDVFLDYGLFWDFGLESPTRITAFAMYDDVHLVKGEVEGFLRRIRGLWSGWLMGGTGRGRWVKCLNRYRRR
jgi:hypothetical protein